jgi:hypothetical protein
MYSLVNSFPHLCSIKSFCSGNGGNGRRATINLGIGHRLLVEDDMAIAGINVFTDYQTKSSHKRLSLLG